MRAISLLVGGTLALLALPAIATAAPASLPTRISSTIETLDGHILDVEAKAGQNVAITLPEGVRTSALANAGLAEVTAPWPAPTRR